MIILHNSYNAGSCAFVAAHGGACTVINWFGDTQAVKDYICKGLPAPAAFPAIVDEETGAIINAAQDPADLTNAIADILSIKARRVRDAQLARTDWAMLPDAPISAEEKAEIEAKRQAWRDVPQQAGFPFTIEWPE